MTLINRIILLSATIATIFLTGCPSGPGKFGGNMEIFDDSVDPAISAIDGAIDDQINSLYAAAKSQRPNMLFSMEIIPLFVDNAWAAACSRPTTAVCINEMKSTDYTACLIDTTQFTINGKVNLAYTGTPNCGFTTVGDSVTRTMNVSRTIPDNGSVSTSSDNQTDHRGIVVGGGTKLTITGVNSYSLDILGVHKIIHNPNNVLKSNDFLIRTTSPISITGGLNRNNRIINGGALEVIDNNNVNTLIPNNLAFTDNCCYPVSGAIKYTISTGGSGTITFPSCGTAAVETQINAKDSVLENVTLVSCE